MLMKLLYLLHVLATVVWVGGMFFAHFVLRPIAVAQLPPPQRLPFSRVRHFHPNLPLKSPSLNR